MLMAARMVHADPRRVLRALTEASVCGPTSADRGWLEMWTRIDRRPRSAIDGAGRRRRGAVRRARLRRAWPNSLPDGATLWASSSMPVRDLDTFFPAQRSTADASSRTAAPTASTASSRARSAPARSSDGPLVLTIGDIAFYHDMNGLLAAKLHGLNATIVLINNDGGGIFSFLPQATTSGAFRGRSSARRTDSTSARPPRLYGASYHLMDGWDDFRQSVIGCARRAGPEDHRGPNRAGAAMWRCIARSGTRFRRRWRARFADAAV